MRELMYHNAIEKSEGKPVTSGGGAEDELDCSAGVEVASPEFGVGGEFIECHYDEMVSFHDGVDHGGDTFKTVKGNRVGGVKGCEEVNEGIWRAATGINAFDSEHHGEDLGEMEGMGRWGLRGKRS